MGQAGEAVFTEGVCAKMLHLLLYIVVLKFFFHFPFRLSLIVLINSCPFFPECYGDEWSSKVTVKSKICIKFD